ncbi:type II toxin-antitoxin system PemK/MazF family toxin [Nakamurella sp. UYEF19]|uniref:type II toxin-antitoxin system PemK/MazF family toxin n=1 Tax=Nakamurella sp. UYEF19 TaxID=1756392 RepID=UPI003390BC4D
MDPRQVGSVQTSYSPVTDGDPDPGEIIWTWVPFEENDGQGKDRPVLVVAAESGGTVLVVQLTSKDHDGDSEFISVGAGDWDSSHRESWVNLERVLRVHPGGMRREASALSRAAFQGVAARLSARYGWR